MFVEPLFGPQFPPQFAFFLCADNGLLDRPPNELRTLDALLLA